VGRALAAASLDPDLPAALPRFLDLYDERLLAHTRPYEGVRPMLERLAPERTLTVLTNKPERATLKLLEGLGLDPFFAEIIGGDSPFGRKPDPAALAHLVSGARATAGSTLLVGDSAVDLETARRGGVRVCLARYGFGFRFSADEFSGDELFIDAPADLPAIIEQL
jgi:phosphoglycolate phosphatase